MAAYIPDRGDIVWLAFDPQSGHEQAGHRSALIVSRKAYNAQVGLCLVCPITSQVKHYGFEVGIPDGLPIAGVILTDQVKSADWKARKAKFICSLPTAVTEDALAKIQALLK